MVALKLIRLFIRLILASRSRNAVVALKPAPGSGARKPERGSRNAVVALKRVRAEAEATRDPVKQERRGGIETHFGRAASQGLRQRSRNAVVALKPRSARVHPRATIGSRNAVVALKRAPAGREPPQVP